jgi:hypothetical protein
LISRVVVGLPRGSIFALGAECPLSAHLSSLPTFLGTVLDFLPDKAFFLYDTLGFPIDLTELMAQEAGMTVDMEGFAAEIEGQKRRSRRRDRGGEGEVSGGGGGSVGAGGGEGGGEDGGEDGGGGEHDGGSGDCSCGG